LGTIEEEKFEKSCCNCLVRPRNENRYQLGRKSSLKRQILIRQESFVQFGAILGEMGVQGAENLF
jgi:hypothetical protein